MRIQLPNPKNKPHNRPATASRGPTHTWGTPLGPDVRPVSGSGKEASLLLSGPLPPTPRTSFQVRLKRTTINSRKLWY
jgi:hypothetical protein